MATTITYTLDPSGSNSGYTRTTLANIESHYNTTYSNNNLVTNDHELVIRMVNDDSSFANYSFSNWSTDATRDILMTGWDSTGGVADQTVTITHATWGQGINGSTKHVTIENLTFSGASNTGPGVLTGSNTVVRNCIFSGYTQGSAYPAIDMSNAGTTAFCLVYDSSYGIEISTWGYSQVYNCTVVDCGTGIFRNGGSGSYTSFVNNVSFGCTSNNWDVGASYLLGRNNFGESGDTIPDTTSTSQATLTSSDFNDYSNDDFTLSSTSRARHTHASFPSGDNHISGYTEDFEGDTLPSTWASVSDSWDAGYDYYVAPVTGVIWRIRDSEISGGAVTLEDTTAIEEVDNATNTSTLSAVSSSTNKDTLKIIDGVIATLSDYSETFSLRGLAVNVDDGELRLTNTNTSYGMHWWGWKEKRITLGALGKIKITGDFINLGTVSTVDGSGSEWTTAWGASADDDNSEFPEPAVLFIGPNTSNLTPYFNIGADTTTIPNDSTHGRTFKFDHDGSTADCQIDFDDNAPTGTDNVYCYNIMLHSKDGQDVTSNKSFGFDTSAGGEVEIEKCYHTGGCVFQDAALLDLDGFGIIQPLEIDNCTDITLDVYRAISAANEINGASTFKNLLNETSMGSFYGLSDEKVLDIYSVVNCSLSTVWLENLAGGYVVDVGGSAGGTDDLTITTLTVIGGGVKVTTSISINLTITTFNHSNFSASYTGYHALYVDPAGARGLTINAINLLTNGIATQEDILNLANVGDFGIYNIDYDTTVDNLGVLSACFNGIISTGTLGKFNEQFVQLTNATQDITFQNFYCSDIPGTPASFVDYDADVKDIRFKNCPYQATDRYDIDDWTDALTDVNFMELNKYDGASNYDGVLVQNFYRSTQSIYTLSGSAKSNKDDGVLLPAVNDYVEVEMPYEVDVGSHTSYFDNAAPTLEGAGNYANFTYQYAIAKNGGSYGSYQTLNGTNLSSESFSANDTFKLKFKVTCPSGQASSTNKIQQIVLSTNPDETVEYPSSLVDVILENVADGSEYWIYNDDQSQVIATGTQSGTSDITISDVAYNGSSETLTVRVRKSSAAPKYKPFNTQATLTNTGARVYVSQELDTIA